MTCAHTVTGPNTEEGWVYYLFLIPDHLDLICRPRWPLEVLNQRRKDTYWLKWLRSSPFSGP